MAYRRDSETGHPVAGTGLTSRLTHNPLQYSFRPAGTPGTPGVHVDRRGGIRVRCRARGGKLWITGDGQVDKVLPSVCERSVSRAGRETVHKTIAKAAPRSAPATSTPAPTIRPAMMACAACCRASPAKRRAAVAARPIRSPPMMLPRSWQRPACPGAPGAAWNRQRQQPTGAPSIKALVAVLLQGGLRRSEAAALRWADVQEAADGRAAASWSTSAGRKPIRTAPRRTCATSRTDAPLRFVSFATGQGRAGHRTGADHRPCWQPGGIQNTLARRHELTQYSAPRLLSQSPEVLVAVNVLGWLFWEPDAADAHRSISLRPAHLIAQGHDRRPLATG